MRQNGYETILISSHNSSTAERAAIHHLSAACQQLLAQINHQPHESSVITHVPLILRDFIR